MRRAMVAALVVGLIVGGTVPGMAQDERMGEDVADLERVEFPEAGIAVSFPPGWSVDTWMWPDEFELPDGSTVATTLVATAAGPDMEMLDGCEIVMYEDMPLSLEEHASVLERDLVFQAENVPGFTMSLYSLPIGDAFLVHLDDWTLRRFIEAYVFDSGTTRYHLTCQDPNASSEWRPIAMTIEPLPDGPSEQPDPVESTAPTPGSQHIEVPGTGVTIAFPSDWTVESVDENSEFQLTGEYDYRQVTTRTPLIAFPDLETFCTVKVYEDMPMPLAEHAEAMLERLDRPDAGLSSTATVVPLPLGDAYRIDTDTTEHGYWTSYLLDAGGTRLDLGCQGDDRPEDDWLPIAETVELLGDGSSDQPEVPADAAAWFSVEDFGSVVEVVDTSIADSFDSSLMRADCKHALWIEHADGSFEERIECTLSEDPVDPPEWQGTWPSETVSVRGGACRWASDYWSVTDGSEVWASSYELTVSPDGHVVGSSRYGAELLDCPE